MIGIWHKRQNRGLEYLLLSVSVLGAKPFHDTVLGVFSYLQSIGFIKQPHSANFPDFNATIIIIVYGVCLFLLVRHSKNNYFYILAALVGLVIFLGLAVINIAVTSVLPSDIVGGYVYGGVWIFF